MNLEAEVEPTPSLQEEQREKSHLWRSWPLFPTFYWCAFRTLFVFISAFPRTHISA